LYSVYVLTNGNVAEQQVLALSDTVLRALSEEFLNTLPPEVREKVRARIGR
jgi:hypothetical protein